MAVSDIFVEFDDLHRAALEKHKTAVDDKQARRLVIVRLMENVVKPFADDMIVNGQKRNITISVDDRGADPLRPSYTIQFNSFENNRSINGAGAPSIKITATENCKQVEVDEQFGSLKDFSDSPGQGTYKIEIGPTTMADITNSMEKWLRETLKLMIERE